MRKLTKWGKIVNDDPFYPDFPYDSDCVANKTDIKIRINILQSIEDNIESGIEDPMQDASETRGVFR